MFPKTKRFSIALAKWIKYGSVYRSPERIAQIFDDFCSQCEKFDVNQCTVCGCRVVRKGRLINKLAWATEKCPLDKFVEEDEVLAKIKEDDAKEKQPPKSDCCS